ncbi:MAG TPA: TAT-variant-translocated molybdopterin oxidoreductase, partial [Candidatus Acidoferrales bacterium]|nr:TAT-variant-translocated molybdopterin oxidoreductase [Candidatus Acidoferrales bacterium]
MESFDNKALDLTAIRERVVRSNGKRLWRDLADLAQTPESREFRDDDFTRRVPAKPAGLSRRNVLKYMAASAAMAGLTACTKLPAQKIVPYVRRPEDRIPGRPLFYATSMQLGGEGLGMLVESHMGRPTKIEGNPGHPGSLGGTDAFMQASILNLYDPDRSQTVMRDVQVSDWTAFVAQISDMRLDWQSTKGAGVRLLTETIFSPTLAAQIRDFLTEFPRAKWHQYEPCGRDSARDGARMAFGQFVNTTYRLERADIVVSLDADFLASGRGHVRYARDFARRRDPDSGDHEMNRLYVIESTPTVTGTMADHRLPLRASDVEIFARALAASLGVSGSPAALTVSKSISDWIAALARDLRAHRGFSIIIAGEQQPP